VASRSGSNLPYLRAQGWISCTVEIQRDRPNRKVYRITHTGREELTQWLQTHQPLPILREPLLAQLYFAAQLPNQAIIDLLEQELEARREKLFECETIHIPPLDDCTASREQTMQRLVLELVTRRQQTYLDWLKDAIATIRNQPL